MARYRVERRSLIVKLDAVWRAILGALDDLGNRRHVLAHFVGRSDPHRAGIPIDDVAQIGERDAAILLEHPLGGDAETRGARGYLVATRLRRFAPQALTPAQPDRQ
jgi:hypothetical protein